MKSKNLFIALLTLWMIGCSKLFAQVQGSWRFENDYDWNKIAKFYTEIREIENLYPAEFYSMAAMVTGFFNHTVVNINNGEIRLDMPFHEAMGSYEPVDNLWVGYIVFNDLPPIKVYIYLMNRDTLIIQSNDGIFNEYANLLKRPVVLRRTQST